jgi:hypothetical protein
MDLKLFSIAGTWKPNDAERQAACELYVELITRVAVVLLPAHRGFVPSSAWPAAASTSCLRCSATAPCARRRQPFLHLTAASKLRCFIGHEPCRYSVAAGWPE